MPTATQRPTGTATPTVEGLPTEVVLVWQVEAEVVMRPTARMWDVTLHVRESPTNYRTWWQGWVERFVEWMEGAS